MTRIATFTYDSEAWRFRLNDKMGEKQVFAIGCLYDGNKWVILKSPKEVAERFYGILMQYPKAIIWAHNWRYDMSLIVKEFINYFNNNGIPVDIPRSDPFFVFLKKDGHTLLLNDSSNFFKGYSLKKLSELFNTKTRKLFTDEDYKLPPEKWNEFLSEHSDRVVNDAVTLYEVVEKMTEEFKAIAKGLNSVYRYNTVSIPQLAFRLLKSSYRRKAIKVHGFKSGLRRFKQIFGHKYEDERIKINELTLEAYLGGRNEAFILNRKPLFMRVLDVNSLYPYVMKSFAYPTIPTNEKTDFFIGDVKFECKKGSRILPILSKYQFGNDSVLTEVYTDKRKMTSVEYNMIEESEECKIISLENPIYFEGEVMFDEFIDYLYKEKQKATENMLKAQKDSLEYFKYKAQRELFKLIMNSSYGKFGQHKARSYTYSLDTYLNKADEWRRLDVQLLINQGAINECITRDHREICLYEGSIVIATEELKPTNHVPIASFVTAYARKVLFDYINIGGKDNVFYADTDSVFTNDEGYYNLRNYLSDTELGKLKLEEDKSGYLKILGKKYYLHFDEYGRLIDYTIKGIPKVKPEKIRTEGDIAIISDVDETFKEIIKIDAKLNINNGKIEGYVKRGYKGIGEFNFLTLPLNQEPKKRLNYVQQGDLEIGYPLDKQI